MKRTVFTLFLLVTCASLFIVLIADLQDYFEIRKSRSTVAVPQSERTVEEVVATVGPAVVAVNTREQEVFRMVPSDPFLRFFGGGRDILREREGIGSGVIFDENGYILTSNHVVGSAREIEVTLADGQRYPAVVCGKDNESDIAVIKIDEKGLPVVSFGDSAGLQVGQWVLAFGNPFGTASHSAQPTVTLGVVSALHRNLATGGGYVYSNLIQTDAAINIGNDGGPLVDLGGRVIGINTFIVTSAGASIGMGFAIPIDSFRGRIDDLKGRQGLQRFWKSDDGNNR
jgi:S1-C subfamily serine protease